MSANKEKVSYSVVSYFCGCGGLDLGFRGGFKYHNEDYPSLPFVTPARLSQMSLK